MNSHVSLHLLGWQKLSNLLVKIAGLSCSQIMQNPHLWWMAHRIRLASSRLAPPPLIASRSVIRVKSQTSVLPTGGKGLSMKRTVEPGYHVFTRIEERAQGNGS